MKKFHSQLFSICYSKIRRNLHKNTVHSSDISLRKMAAQHEKLTWHF